MVFTWRPALLMGLGLIPFIFVPETGVILLWLMVVALLCLGDALLAVSPHQVSVTRSYSRQLRQSETGQSTLTLTHTSRRTARGVVRDAWQPAAGTATNRHPLDIRSGARQRVTTHFTPTRRGTVLADAVTVRLLGPLRLSGRQLSLPVPGGATVLPAFTSRKHLPSKIARLHEIDGATSVLIHGQGTEFDSLREYVIGDDVRSIDWRATARNLHPVVRTWRPERDRQVFIVLDTGRVSATRIGDETRLEAGIESALLLGALATQAGDRVDLMAYDRRMQQQVNGTTPAQILRSMAQALAVTFPRLVETHWPGIVQEIHRRFSRRALIVLITTLDPAVAQSGILRVIEQLTQKHTVVIAQVNDPDLHSPELEVTSLEDTYRLAAAGRTLSEYAAVRRLVTRAGAFVVDGTGEELPPALADQYLWLKSEGLL